jgi:L-alanine-DL-glutamate epimerase-like enolase superfamily enzyme
VKSAAVRLESLSLARLELPLKSPYKLAFGAVRAFDTILVEARDRDGSHGWGEATILPGYTDETPRGAWTAACRMAKTLAGKDTAEAKNAAARLIASDPFAATALVTALEMLEGDPLLEVEARTAVPLLAILNETDEPAIEREVEARLAEGYRTLKVKVGFEPGDDLARVRLIQRLAQGRAHLRLDGNQGYGCDQAVAFAAALDPDGIELLEQPCAAGDWEAALAVARTSPVPMMLDESIYGPAEIDRAAELDAAALIKLKLMKMGGLSRLAEGLAHISARGMTPVLGNGVAGELGCWMEACVAHGRIDTAGEMNGFLKPREGLFSKPLAVEAGALVLEPGRPEIDWTSVTAMARETATFETGTATARGHVRP